MVNLIVTIDAELLRRMDTAVQPDLAAEGSSFQRGLVSQAPLFWVARPLYFGRPGPSILAGQAPHTYAQTCVCVPLDTHHIVHHTCVCVFVCVIVCVCVRVCVCVCVEHTVQQEWGA